MAVFRMDFESMFEARRAIAKLRECGYEKAYLDMVDKYNEEYSEEIFAGSPLSAPNLSSAALKSGTCKAHLEKPPLAASNPAVSGVGSLCELTGNRAASLFVNYETDKTEELKNILNEFIKG